MKLKSALLFVGRLLFCLSAALTALLYALYVWVFRTWPHLKLDELIFHLSTSTEGTSPALVAEGAVSLLVPLLLALAGALLLARRIRRRGARREALLYGAGTALLLLTLLPLGKRTWSRLEIGSYLSGEDTSAQLLREYYVNPGAVEITFPEKKKNLVYIYLESMETTFADQASGGAFEQNVIPELTALAQEHEDFSGAASALNGAYAPEGATWTMGALFAQTAGLPLKISIESNSMNTQSSFFPDLVNLGDVLQQAGYNQAFLIGSDGNFAGRSMYFEQHGGYEILDYQHAMASGRLSPGYYVWWGYEDERLFEYAREEVAALAAQDEPFNLTILTVDTHFEDGYVCDQCQTEFEDSYANVYACSSRQVSEFVAWLQQQDFYENTVIVLAGDHLTMDSDFCAEVSGDYARRVYTAWINTEKRYEGEAAREYTTFDFFPTTLSALGAVIEGDRLGLGADLFSQEQTLVEQMGIGWLNDQLRRANRILEPFGQVERVGDCALTIEYEQEAVRFTVSGISGVEGVLQRVELEVEGDETGTLCLTLEPDRAGCYVGEASLEALVNRYAQVRAYAVCEDGERWRIASVEGDLALCDEEDVYEYLRAATQVEDYTLLLAVADNASEVLSEPAAELLRALGLKRLPVDLYRYGYCAVVGPDGVQEKRSRRPISLDGLLADGTPYQLYSAGFYTGQSGCSQMIGGADYAVNLRGLNVVVYDHAHSRVVGAAVFDVLAG